MTGYLQKLLIGLDPGSKHMNDEGTQNCRQLYADVQDKGQTCGKGT